MNILKLVVEGTSDEIKEAIDAISGSKDHFFDKEKLYKHHNQVMTIEIDPKKIEKSISLFDQCLKSLTKQA